MYAFFFGNLTILIAVERPIQNRNIAIGNVRIELVFCMRMKRWKTRKWHYKALGIDNFNRKIFWEKISIKIWMEKTKKMQLLFHFVRTPQMSRHEQHLTFSVTIVIWQPNIGEFRERGIAKFQPEFFMRTDLIAGKNKQIQENIWWNNDRASQPSDALLLDDPLHTGQFARSTHSPTNEQERDKSVFAKGIFCVIEKKTNKIENWKYLNKLARWFWERRMLGWIKTAIKISGQ